MGRKGISLVVCLLWVLACSSGGDPEAVVDEISSETSSETSADIGVDSSAAVDTTPAIDPGSDNSSQDEGLLADAGQPTEPEAYLGGWLKAACANEIEGTGTTAGDIAYDFEQMDQFGEPLRLYDFCDRAILLVGSAYW